MALWRLYYHVVWATKQRLPLITQKVEPLLYGYITGKAHSLGCIVHAIGGTEDHIHLVISIPPKLSVADLVGIVKGSSTHYLNHDLAERLPQFSWQRGYGALSLGSKQLDDAVAYVRNQKTHHHQGGVIAGLERDMDDEDGPLPWHDGEAITGIRIP